MIAKIMMKNNLGSNAKITVQGEVNLGEELELIQESTAKLDTKFRFSSGLPINNSLSKVDIPYFKSERSTLPAEQLTWHLKPTRKQISITNKGLTESYMIFGGPGSGKTYLLMYLLKQIFQLNLENPNAKVGALILDPKAALIEDVQKMLAEAGRLDDLVILNHEMLNQKNEAVNIIDTSFDGEELGELLVLAAQASGVSASEEYWFGAMITLLSGAIPLLSWRTERILTLEHLMSSLLEIDNTSTSGRPPRQIEKIAIEARGELAGLSATKRNDMLLAIQNIEGFYRQEADNIATVEVILRRAYSNFRRSKWHCFSYPAPNIPGYKRTTFYDSIINEGKIVLVSIGPEDAAMAKVICTLVKIIFQRMVLSRLNLVRSGKLDNFERLVVMAADEYSAVASELAGAPLGDGLFFSQCRQNGAIGIVATQSVNLLQTSSLKENWKAITSVCAAKIFMRLGDNETVEEATKLAAEYDFNITSIGTSQQKDGSGSSTNKDLRERKALPAAVLTQTLKMGQGAIIGSLDGKATTDSLRFFQTPQWYKG